MFAAEHSPAEKHFLALLLVLVVVLVLGRLTAIVCRKIKQPVVIGEILVGIALGPSLLGVIWPEAQEFLFSATELPFFRLVAGLGLVLFMFIVGLEVDLSVIARSGKRAAAISLTSIAFPFLLGFTLLAPYLYDDHKCVPVEAGEQEVTPCSEVPADVQDRIDERDEQIADAEAEAGATVPQPLVPRETDFTPFAMFVAVSMCGTAFAVLARILSERNMFKIPLGLLLIACAAIDDIMAFTLLALSTALAGEGSASDVVFIVIELVIFVAVLFLLVRPLLERLVLRPYRANGNKMGAEQMSILLIGLLVSSYITSQIGVHELIGAFLFGVAVPRYNAPNLFHSIADRIEGVSVQLLLPVFFVIAGQGVYLNNFSIDWLVPTLLILLVACVGKFVGGYGAARVTGVPRRQSLAVGTLMNTRGLAELVILQVGRDAGVIGDQVYTMLVIMAIVTTAMAGPLLRIVYPDRWLQRDIAEAERKRTSSATDRVAVLVSDPATSAPLAQLAAAYGGGRKTGSVTLVRFTGQDAGLAGIAENLGEMKSLQDTVEAAGLTCQVVSRVASDRPADVVSEITRIAPAAVIIDAADRDLTDAIRRLGSDVLLPTGPIADVGGVEVAGGSSDAELAGVEMAVRMSLHAGVPLLITGGMPGRTARQLRTLGVVRVDDAADLAQPVASVGRADGDTVIVEAGERDRVVLTEALEGWTEPTILASSI